MVPSFVEDLTCCHLIIVALIDHLFNLAAGERQGVPTGGQCSALSALDGMLDLTFPQSREAWTAIPR